MPAVRNSDKAPAPSIGDAMPAPERNKRGRKPKTPAVAAAETNHAANLEPPAPVTGTATVTVGLKHANGLWLTLQTKVAVQYPAPGGFVERVEWRPDPSLPRYRLNGNATPTGVAPRCLIVNGFAMTPGIPKDFWLEWLSQNKNLDLVQAGLVIAHENGQRVQDEAKEKRDLKSGLEPLALNTKGELSDDRIPKRRLRDGTLEDMIQTGTRSGA